MGGERRAHGSARIAGGGLHPELVEYPGAQQLAVRHAVERDSPREAEIAFTGLLRDRSGQLEDDLLRNLLYRRRHVHVQLRQQLVGTARGRAEQPVEALVRHAQAGAVVEVIEVEVEGPVRLDIDELPANDVRKGRLPVRG